jgi:hypothetical protein
MVCDRQVRARKAMEAADLEIDKLEQAASLYRPVSARAAQLFRSAVSAGWVGSAAAACRHGSTQSREAWGALEGGKGGWGRFEGGRSGGGPTLLYAHSLGLHLRVVAAALRETRTFLESAAGRKTAKAEVVKAPEPDDEPEPAAKPPAADGKKGRSSTVCKGLCFDTHQFCLSFVLLFAYNQTHGPLKQRASPP